MSNPLIWKNYKAEVVKTLVNHGDDTPEILLYNLTGKVGAFFNNLQIKLAGENAKQEEMEKLLGDILWNVAALELTYELHPCKGSDYIGHPIQIVAEEGVELDFLGLHCSAMDILAEMSGAIYSNDVDLIQYSLAQMFSLTFDICAISNTVMVDCLGINVDAKTSKKTAKIDQHKEEYKLTKENIKKAGSFEVMFDIIVDTKTRVYQGLKVKKGRNVKTFCSSDLVVDFFNASNAIAEDYKNIAYRFNYSPTFRSVLSQIKDKVFSGYINGYNLISAMEVQKNLQSKNKDKTVFIDRTFRPILMHADMKTLDDLLMYVNTIKNKK